MAAVEAVRVLRSRSRSVQSALTDSHQMEPSARVVAVPKMSVRRAEAFIVGMAMCPSRVERKRRVLVARCMLKRRLAVLRHRDFASAIQSSY